MNVRRERTERVVRRFRDAQALARAAAVEVTREARSAVIRTGRFTLALAGGNTPLGIYHELAGDQTPLPWNKTTVLFGDERVIPPDHADSNYRAAKEALLDRLPTPPERIVRVRGELSPSAAATVYERELREAFPGVTAEGFMPLDLVILGIGTDGHVASLFPGSPALMERRRWTAAIADPPAGTIHPRVTLTLPALDAARMVMIVAGPEKKSIVEDILDGRGRGVPAARLAPRRLAWFMVDPAMAAPVADDDDDEPWTPPAQTK